MKKLFSIEFVVAGTRQLRKGQVSAKDEKAVANSVISQFGFCEYLVINEL